MSRLLGERVKSLGFSYKKNYSKISLVSILLIAGISRIIILLREYPLLPGQDPYMHIAFAILSKNTGMILEPRPFWYSFSIIPHLLLRSLACLGVDLTNVCIFLTISSVVAQVYIIYLIGRSQRSHLAGLLAGLSIALSPLYVARSSIPMPETWAMPFYFSAILYQQKGRSLLAFLLSALVALIHPLTYVFCLITLISMEIIINGKKRNSFIPILHGMLAIFLYFSSGRYFHLISLGFNRPRLRDVLSMGPVAFPIGLFGLAYLIKRRRNHIIVWTVSNISSATGINLLTSPISSTFVRSIFFLIPSLSICGGILLDELFRNYKKTSIQVILTAFVLLVMSLNLFAFPNLLSPNPPSSTLMMREPMILLKERSENSLIVIPSTSEDVFLKAIAISQKPAIKVEWIPYSPSIELASNLGIKTVRLNPDELSQRKIKESLGYAEEVLLLGGEKICPRELEDEIRELGYRTIRIEGRNRFETIAQLSKFLWRKSEIAIVCSADNGKIVSSSIKVASMARIPLLLFSDDLVRNYDNEEKSIARSSVVGALRYLGVKYIYPVGLGEESLRYLKKKGFLIADHIEGFESDFSSYEGVIVHSLWNASDFIERSRVTAIAHNFETHELYVYVDPIFGSMYSGIVSSLVEAGGKVVWLNPNDGSALIEFSDSFIGFDEKRKNTDSLLRTIIYIRVGPRPYFFKFSSSLEGRWARHRLSLTSY